MPAYEIAQKQRYFTRLIIAVSILIPVVVAVLYGMAGSGVVAANINVSFLPAFHAILNSLTALLLILAFLFIKNKMIVAHKTATLTALLLSVIFLVSYVVYHSLADSTSYEGSGLLKYFYYFILSTHIVLAAGVVPLVLFTFMRSLSGEFEKHRKIARWTLPIWLYVSISGVLVYLMISPYYG